MEYGFTVEEIGLQIANTMGASITILHIIPPINMDYHTSRTVKENPEYLTDTDTILGRVLRKGLENARQSSLDAVLKIRQGNIVPEILEELQSGEYDLICMGSPYSTHSLRQLYRPNVTAEVAEIAGCPALIARFEVESNTTIQM
ncbi:MAG: universal stress protein [Anaerolineales bacterium]|nr:universal stress protein [Anaerolineales bacterium]